MRKSFLIIGLIISLLVLMNPVFAGRYYIPEIGRWATPDPALQKMSPKWLAKNGYYSVSPYAYVFNNPLKYIDPTGEVIELAGTDEEKEYLRKILDTYKGANETNADVYNSLDNSENVYVFSFGKVDEGEVAHYQPNEEGGGKLAVDLSKISGSNRKIFYESVMNTAHETYHAFQHDNLGLTYYKGPNTTLWEGEAFDHQFRTYHSLRQQTSVGFKYSETNTNPIFKSYMNYRRNTITPYYRSYMKAIYNQYIKYGHKIKYVGP